MASDCETKLTAARDALHALMLGERAVVVQTADRRMEFSRVNLAELEAYIAKLEAECGGCNGTAKKRKPFEVQW